MVRRNGLCGRRKDGFRRVFYAKSGLEGPSHRTNRILRGLPNIPRLTWFYLLKLLGAQFGAQTWSPVGVKSPELHRSVGFRWRREDRQRLGLKKIPSHRFFALRFVPRIVIPSMNASLIAALIAVPEQARGFMCADFAYGLRGLGKWTPVRHATCIPSVFLEKDSHSLQESVDFSKHRAKVAQGDQKSSATRSRAIAARRRAGQQFGWNHGAARNGNRKRTRVRVACGGGIRPRGLGHQPIHGHFGLSVVGRELCSPVVHLPACELRVRQRHFSRGPGLLAALTSRDMRLARSSVHERHPHIIKTVRATRPAGFNVIRGDSVLKCPPERPAAGRGPHQPSPRTRLRLG